MTGLARSKTLPGDLATRPPGFASARAALRNGASVVDLVGEGWRRTNAAAQDGVFITIAEETSVLAEARRIDERRAAGVFLPLDGLTFSVKDNVHVAGFPTTANCEAIRILPEESAYAIARLQAAGAVVVAKNTLDQFATGLNGTRSAEPLCRNAVDSDYIPGGSSSGSAVAVARGLTSFSIGTDTGGSGRVPAACNGIVGVKPTLGLVSGRGLLYNSRLFDTLSVFALDTADAYEILAVMAGHDPHDPFSREDADAVETHAVSAGRMILATPRADQLAFFGDSRAEAAFAADLAALRAAGYTLEEVDFTPFEAAGKLLFDSAFIAERLIEYGAVIEASPEMVHPDVRAAIEPGARYSAQQAFEAIYRLESLKRQVACVFREHDALVLPTTPTIFTIAEMLAEPTSRNAAMGRYTYFANPLDLCAASVPGTGRSDGLPSALSILARATSDAVVHGVARSFEAAVRSRLTETGPDCVRDSP